MKKVLLVVAAILVAMSASANAGYKPAAAEARKPAVVKEASSGGSSYAKGKTSFKSGMPGKSTGYNSGGFKAGRK